MNIVGFDLGKRKSQICVTDEDGTVLAEFSINTTRDEIASALEPFGVCRVLIESSTSSEWVARVLEKNGHTVVVADPRFSLMYAQANKKIKTDKRDARGLAHALRLKAYKEAHRMSDESRALYGRLLARRSFVAMRTKLITQVRAHCEKEGICLPKCGSEYFHDSLDGLALPEGSEWLFAVISPLREEIGSLNAQIEKIDDELAEIAAKDPRAKNLMTTRGVGPITSLAFVAVIDDPKRFESAQQVSAYLGLVPGEHNSGGSKRHPGAITKSGNSMLRSLLVEAAYNITRRTAPKSALKTHFEKIVKKSGGRKEKKKAAVAIARRLSRILWAMLRDEKPFEETKTKPLVQPQTQSAQKAVA